jgi:hypothetical protein
VPVIAEFEKCGISFLDDIQRNNAQLALELHFSWRGILAEHCMGSMLMEVLTGHSIAGKGTSRRLDFS